MRPSKSHGTGKVHTLIPILAIYVQVCPSAADKINVLLHMIFPLTQKVGQTIIFVKTKETARQLHSTVSL